MSDSPTPPPPKPSIGYILLFIFGLALFLGGAGCTLAYVAFLFGQGVSAGGVMGLLLMLGALVLLVKALQTANRNQKLGKSGGDIWLYLLLLPIVAVFIFGGGCVIGINEF